MRQTVVLQLVDPLQVVELDVGFAFPTERPMELRVVVVTCCVSDSVSRGRMAPRARFELATLRLTAECSTVELPGNRATPLFSFYYRKQIRAMTFRKHP